MQDGMSGVSERALRGLRRGAELGAVSSLPEADGLAFKARIDRRIVVVRRQRTIVGGTLGLALLAGLGVAGTRWRASPPGPVAVSTPALPAGPIVEPVAPEAPSVAGRLTLADGTIVTMLEGGSVVEPQEVTPTLARIDMRRGRARFELPATSERTFEVTAGRVRVEVLGQAVTIKRVDEGDDGSIEVAVEEGRARVVWPGGEKILAAGERDAVRDVPQDLMLAADVARLSHHPEKAVAPLRRLIARYPNDDRASPAAFLLGRVLLESLHRPREAAEAFARARRLAPQGALAEDALGREMQARAQGGETARAKSLAEEYLRRYPQGSRRELVRELLGR